MWKLREGPNLLSLWSSFIHVESQWAFQKDHKWRELSEQGWRLPQWSIGCSFIGQLWTIACFCIWVAPNASSQWRQSPLQWEHEVLEFQPEPRWPAPCTAGGERPGDSAPVLLSTPSPVLPWGLKSSAWQQQGTNVFSQQGLDNWGVRSSLPCLCPGQENRTLIVGKLQIAGSSVLFLDVMALCSLLSLGLSVCLPLTVCCRGLDPGVPLWEGTPGHRAAASCFDLVMITYRTSVSFSDVAYQHHHLEELLGAPALEEPPSTEKSMNLILSSWFRPMSCGSNWESPLRHRPSSSSCVSFFICLCLTHDTSVSCLFILGAILSYWKCDWCKSTESLLAKSIICEGWIYLFYKLYSDDLRGASLDTR